MELTQEEKKVIVNLLSQVSLPVNQAPTVITIIQKLQLELQPGKKEGKGLRRKEKDLEGG